MKRVRIEVVDQDSKDLQTAAHVYQQLVSGFGAEDHFVRAFFAQALSYVALDPAKDDHKFSAIADLALVNRFFYDAYCLMNKTIVFPHLDALFARLVTEYDAWTPGPDWAFTPFSQVIKMDSFKVCASTIRWRFILPLVSRTCVLSWLANHRLASPMPDKDAKALAASIAGDYWISWLQWNMDQGNNKYRLFFNKPWQAHQIPTLMCWAVAQSHRCIDIALKFMTKIFATDRDRQRELLLVWTFFGLVTSGRAKLVTDDIWLEVASYLIYHDKMKKNLELPRYLDWYKCPRLSL